MHADAPHILHGAEKYTTRPVFVRVRVHNSVHIVPHVATALYRRPLLPGDINSDSTYQPRQDYTTVGAGHTKMGRNSYDADNEQKKPLQKQRRRQQDLGEKADGTAGGNTYLEDDEDPWARKRRMEMVIRRKEAKLRAQGVPINGAGLARSSSSSTAMSRVG